MNERSELEEALGRWQVDEAAVRERVYHAPTPCERERWHALWLALHGWPRARAAALGRDLHIVPCPLVNEAGRERTIRGQGAC